MSLWERAHWIAYFRLKPQVESYYSLIAGDEDPINITEYLEMSEEDRQAAMEFNQYQELLKVVDIESRREWVAMHPDIRRMKIEFAQKVKAKQVG